MFHTTSISTKHQRYNTSRPMAKRKGQLTSEFASGRRKFLTYGIACLMCVSAGAYIGHSSQANIDIDSSSNLENTSKTSVSIQQTPEQLEIKYAYFGAPSVQMPSEKIKSSKPSAPQAKNKLVAEPRPEKQSLISTDAVTSIYHERNNSSTSEINTISVQQPGTGDFLAAKIATVSKGDSFSTIGQRFGLSVRETANIMQDKLAAEHLNTIIPGEQITFELSEDRKITQIVYVIDNTKTLVLDRKNATKFVTTLDEVALEKRTLVNMGVVENSLFLSAAEAGVSNKNIMQMVDIFRWDIDFAMDVQPGDTFKIVYEGFYKNEKLVRTGKLLGVEFKGRSTHQALYFEDANGDGGYFTPRGRQLEKQFLRNPVDTVRITSPFNLRRKHPVLNTIKAHKGVDYGAPTGTPIKATADGTVKYSGRRGTYGLTVELQHGKRYTTLYAHMSKIHPASNVGKKVKQGQVIGYVGKTGRVTGAHLHYEFRVKGVHVNPQTVKFAGAGTVPDDQMRQFKITTAPVMHQLTALKPNRLALTR